MIDCQLNSARFPSGIVTPFNMSKFGRPMNRNIPDFDKLALAAHPVVDQIGRVEDLDALWSQLFELDTWYFLGEPKTIYNALDGVKPFQWDRRQNGETWLLAFTDLNRANRWKETQDSQFNDDRVHFMSLTPDEARSHIRSLIGSKVIGIRFNEGSDYGWAARVEDIDPIFNHLFGSHGKTRR